MFGFGRWIEFMMNGAHVVTRVDKSVSLNWRISDSLLLLLDFIASSGGACLLC